MLVHQRYIETVLPEIPLNEKETFQTVLTKTCTKILENENPFRDNRSTSVYTGTAGIAFLFYQIYLFQPDFSIDGKTSLDIAKFYIENSILNCTGRLHSNGGFLCTEIGVYSVAAAIYQHISEDDKAEAFIKKWYELANNYRDCPDELLYGRAGILYSVLFLKSNLRPDLLTRYDLEKLSKNIIYLIMENGIETSIYYEVPLMWEWKSKPYLGAAHGVAGIITLLLQFPSLIVPYEKRIKNCLEFLMNITDKDYENYPTSFEGSKDTLVQFCHGSPGILICFCHAYEYFGVEKYLHKAMSLGQIVESKGLLRKGVGLCHGISGNSISFSELYRITRNLKYLELATKFLLFGSDWEHLTEIKTFSTPDRPFSLFEGLSGYASAVLYHLHQVYYFPCFDDMKKFE